MPATMNELPRLAIPSTPIAGTTDRFPVRRIFCVGQNYADHAREMGSDPRQPPFFFTKPADAVTPSGLRLPFPTRTANLHHEVELVVALGKGGVSVTPTEAPCMIFGYAVGIDLTRRDLQTEAKQSSRPWDMSKGFDHSALVGLLTKGLPPHEAAITLTIDGVVRQSGNLMNMVWSVMDVVSILSTSVTLAAGDLIFTGTPAGVGPIHRGEKVRGVIEGIDAIEVTFI